jgi:hypothetical protein
MPPTEALAIELAAFDEMLHDGGRPPTQSGDAAHALAVIDVSIGLARWRNRRVLPAEGR